MLVEHISTQNKEILIFEVDDAQRHFSYRVTIDFNRIENRPYFSVQVKPIVTGVWVASLPSISIRDGNLYLTYGKDEIPVSHIWNTEVAEASSDLAVLLQNIVGTVLQ